MDTILQPAFWDVSFDALSWEEHRDFIIRRILQVGSLEMITWLRSQLNDDALRSWLKKNKGRGLSPRQLHYWKVILGLSPQMVDRWIANQDNTWNHRICTPKT